VEGACEAGTGAASRGAPGRAPAASRSATFRLLGRRDVLSILAFSIVARLPLAMASLALVLRLVTGGDSYAFAGLAAAVYTVGGAVSAPYAGRLADRFGRSAVLLGGAAVNGAGLVLLSVLPTAAGPRVLVLAVAAGCASPPVSAIVRSVWPGLAVAEGPGALFALDATLQELTFVVGPGLVAVIAALSGAAGALQASAALGLAGALGLSVLAPIRARSRERHARRGPASPRLPAFITVGFLMVAGASVTQLALIADCTRHGSPAEAGWVIAVWGLGSMAGGALFGTRVNAAGPIGLVVALGAIAAGFALLMVAPGVAGLYPLVALAGLGGAPALGCLYHLVAAVAPAQRVVESFGWVAAGLQAGLAGGTALGGVVVDRLGVAPGYAVAAGATALAAAATVLVGEARARR
jgi:MFS family permease